MALHIIDHPLVLHKLRQLQAARKNNRESDIYKSVSVVFGLLIHSFYIMWLVDLFRRKKSETADCSMKYLKRALFILNRAAFSSIRPAQFCLTKMKIISRLLPRSSKTLADVLSMWRWKRVRVKLTFTSKPCLS